MTHAEPVFYEQPINEHIRVCLRLEHLFMQVMHWMRGQGIWESRAALAAILEILNVLDRPDLRGKFVKELGRYAATLSRFAEMPNIDRTKLRALQTEIEPIAHQLHGSQGRLGQQLRDNDFLIAIRQYLLTPGGGCSFDTPVFHCWLQQPATERIAQLTHWLGGLKLVRSAVDLMLRLVRQSSAPQTHIASQGFYQASLDAQTPCQLVRVMVAQAGNLYPEISVGRHGISVRFNTLSIDARPTQVAEDVKFHLTCCVF